MRTESDFQNAQFEMQPPNGMILHISSDGKSVTVDGGESDVRLTDAAGNDLLRIKTKDGNVLCLNETVKRRYTVTVRTAGTENEMLCFFKMRKNRQSLIIPKNVHVFSLTYDPVSGSAVEYEEPEPAKTQPEEPDAQSADSEDDLFGNPLAEFRQMQARMEQPETFCGAYAAESCAEQTPTPENAPSEPDSAEETARIQAETLRQHTAAAEQISEMRAHDDDADNSYLQQLLAELEMDMETLALYENDSGVPQSLREQLDRTAAVCGKAKSMIGDAIAARQRSLDTAENGGKP